VSNVGGAGLLAADACTGLGLTVHQPRGLTRRRLRTLLPGGTVTGPVDTTAAVTAEAFRRCLELLAADDGVDAMIVLVQPTGANGDLITRSRTPTSASRSPPSRSTSPKPPAAATVGRRPDSGLRRSEGGGRRAGPRGQVRDLAHRAAAARCHGFPDVRAADARALVTGFLHRETAAAGCRPTRPPTCCTATASGWSTPRRPASEDEAVKAAEAVSGPVALKAEVPGLVPGTDA
jgi:acyl-CoA synthetase (NDP forming)